MTQKYIDRCIPYVYSYMAYTKGPRDQGNTKALKFRLYRTYRKALPMFCCESKKIYDNESKIPMNSKSEWHSSAVERVVFTREVEEQVAGGGGGQAVIQCGAQMFPLD